MHIQVNYIKLEWKEHKIVHLEPMKRLCKRNG